MYTPHTARRARRNDDKPRKTGVCKATPARFFLLAALFVFLSACAAREADAPAAPPLPLPAASASPATPVPGSEPPPLSPAPPPSPATPREPYRRENLPPVPEGWRPLLERLKADGLDGADVRAFLIAMGDSYSPAPMGTKIKELYSAKYLRKPRPQPATPLDPERVYPGFVTPATVELCRAYLDANEFAFTVAEDMYLVPRRVIVALLMVETKLGAYLGRENAFWSLACMAAADSPARIPEPLEALPGVTDERLAWISGKLKERSNWAYKELKALLEHVRRHDLDPLAMPGSVYGAIGLCQFMPSNLKPYGVDGDEDGKVDLFDPADAIPSAAHYLHAHGWKSTMTRDQQRAVIKRYNNSTVYANTILALAGALEE